jgi:hypothetical protein
MRARWSSLGTWLAILLAAVAAEVSLEYCRLVIAPVWSHGGPWLLEWWEAGFGLVAIVALFFLLGLTLRMTWRGGKVASASDDESQSFPTDDTVLVGVWLVLVSLAFIVGFALLLHFFKPVAVKGVAPFSELVGALYMAVAAGIGAAVTTISAFNEHAAEKRDFKRSYVAWYVSRPILASLLGLVFYMAIRAGFFLANGGVKVGNSVVVPPSTQAQYLQFAFIGALVGMFAKPAVEKLRELFDTFFQTKSSTAQEILDRLPQELRDKVAPYVPEGGGPDGSGGLERAAIAKVADEDTRKKLTEAFDEQREQTAWAEAERTDGLVRFYEGLTEDLREALRPHLECGVVEKSEAELKRSEVTAPITPAASGAGMAGPTSQRLGGLESGPDDV